ncbi:hypothetical protein [Vescimonas sanitatis]|uniref:hypothetical protein n=1 Tax=Vescimonas sanitatis TaxID=3376993 RepID=UPI003B7E4B89
MFMLSRMLVGNTPPIVYMQPTDGETYQVGEALKLASGKVTLCSGAVAPSHVCVGPIDDNGVVPCVEVQKYMEFETTLGVAPADSATVGVGDKVTLHTDGMQVTATKTSGVAEVTGIDGQTVGSHVTVKF